MKDINIRKPIKVSEAFSLGGFEMGFIKNEAEVCPRCGRQIYAFSKKKAASDGIEYCIKCAEEVDRDYLQAYACSMCKRLIGKQEIKFVLPSSAYGSANMPMEKRLLCTTCYNRYSKRLPSKIALLGRASKVAIMSRARKQFSQVIARR
jgi:ribosomal protein L37E